MGDPSIIDPVPAPPFALPDGGGRVHELSSLLGSWPVLVFLPEAKQRMSVLLACAYREHAAAFRKRGVPVWMIWKESQAVSREFVKKFSLPFPLLSDESMAVIRAYGVWSAPSGKQGRWQGVVPTAVLIASDGYKTRHWKVHTAAQSPVQVLEALETYLK